MLRLFTLSEKPTCNYRLIFSSFRLSQKRFIQRQLHVPFTLVDKPETYICRVIFRFILGVSFTPLLFPYFRSSET